MDHIPFHNLTDDDVGSSAIVNHIQHLVTVSSNLTYVTVTVDNSTNVTQTDQSDGVTDRVQSLISEPHKCIALALGLIAITLNVLSLLALSQIRSRISNHYRLIISLALSDIVIGISVILYIVHSVLNKSCRLGFGPREVRFRYWCTAMFVKALNSTGLNISLLNLLGMALDHYAAIVRPLHYPSLINGKKSFVFYAGTWIFALLLGFSDFLTGFDIYFEKDNIYNYCEACYKSHYQDDYAVFFITILTTIAMTFIYVKLYIKIKHYRSPGQVVQSSGRKNSTRSDITRNKRALITTLLILLTFMICWLPNCLLQITLLIQVSIDKSLISSWIGVLENMGWYMYDILLINSIADPIIYAVRTFDVQLGYRRLIRKCCPRLKTVTYADYVVRTNLIDRKTTSNKVAQNNTNKGENGVELQRTEKCVGANISEGNIRQVIFPRRDKSDSATTSSSRSHEVVVYRACQSEP